MDDSRPAVHRIAHLSLATLCATRTSSTSVSPLDLTEEDVLPSPTGKLDLATMFRLLKVTQASRDSAAASSASAAASSASVASSGSVAAPSAAGTKKRPRDEKRKAAHSAKVARQTLETAQTIESDFTIAAGERTQPGFTAHPLKQPAMQQQGMPVSSDHLTTLDEAAAAGFRIERRDAKCVSRATSFLLSRSPSVMYCDADGIVFAGVSRAPTSPRDNAGNPGSRFLADVTTRLNVSSTSVWQPFSTRADSHRLQLDRQEPAPSSLPGCITAEGRRYALMIVKLIPQRPGRKSQTAAQRRCYARLAAEPAFERFISHIDGPFAVSMIKLTLAALFEANFPGTAEMYRATLDEIDRRLPELNVRSGLCRSKYFAMSWVNAGPASVSPAHRDFRNLAAGLCVVNPFFNFRGDSAFVLLYEAKLAIQVRRGASHDSRSNCAGESIFLPSALVTHGNTPILGANETRGSFAHYTPAPVFQWLDFAGVSKATASAKAEYKAGGAARFQAMLDLLPHVAVPPA